METSPKDDGSSEVDTVTMVTAPASSVKEQQQDGEPRVMLDVTVKCEHDHEGDKVGSEGDTKRLLTYKRRQGSQPSVTTSAATAQVTMVTPKVEPTSSRPVRANRGMKRRYPGDLDMVFFPGDESDDAETRKPARVRSMTEVFAESARYSTPSDHSGKENGQQRGTKRLRAKKRGKQSRSNGTRKVVLRGVNGTDYGTEQQRQGNIYVCNHEGCDKVFAEAGALYRHARVHGDRPYVCHYEGCNRRFLERSKLKRHYLIHTGEKSFICGFEGCGKAFSLDFNLRSHMKTHTGDYHECPHKGCEKKYCQNYKLRAHMCKDHNLVEGNDALLEALKETPEMKAAKKQEKLLMLVQRKERLGKWRDGRKKRIYELEAELERESKELGKIDKALKKLDREKDQLEVSEGESDFSSSADEDLLEPDIEQATCDEKEVLVFAHKPPTADQGARLVQGDARMVLVGSPSEDVLVPKQPKVEFSSSPSSLLANNSNSSSGSKKLIEASSSSSNVWNHDVWTQQQQQQQKNQQQQQHAQQHELPVSHLFSFQEQPCLVD